MSAKPSYSPQKREENYSLIYWPVVQQLFKVMKVLGEKKLVLEVPAITTCHVIVIWPLGNQLILTTLQRPTVTRSQFGVFPAWLPISKINGEVKQGRSHRLLWSVVHSLSSLPAATPGSTALVSHKPFAHPFPFSTRCPPYLPVCKPPGTCLTTCSPHLTAAVKQWYRQVILLFTTTLLNNRNFSPYYCG